MTDTVVFLVAKTVALYLFLMGLVLNAIKA